MSQHSTDDELLANPTEYRSMVGAL